MSADNYFRIRAHAGRFAVVMGFASDAWCREPRDTDPHFPTLREAAEHAAGRGAEYGYEVGRDAQELERVRTVPVAGTAARLRAAVLTATEVEPPEADPETAFGPLLNSGRYRAGWHAAMKAVRAAVDAEPEEP